MSEMGKSNSYKLSRYSFPHTKKEGINLEPILKYLGSFLKEDF